MRAFILRTVHHFCHGVMTSVSPFKCCHGICSQLSFQPIKYVSTSRILHQPRGVNTRLERPLEILAKEAEDVLEQEKESNYNVSQRLQTKDSEHEYGRKDSVINEGTKHRWDLHTPVMVNEILEFLEPVDNQVFLDMTFGAGGHTKALLKSNPTVSIYALDRDPEAFRLAQNLASEGGLDHVFPLHGRFTDVQRLLSEAGVSEKQLDGVIIDAGCSSMQMDSPERGFSLSKEGPLDMRMDGDRSQSAPTAGDIVNILDKDTLSNIIRTYGEEKHHKKIASLIVDYRNKYKRIESTSELATVISFGFSHNETRQSVDKLGRRVHVATKTFQALRIFVNDELNELNQGLNLVAPFLKRGGKVAVLSFHSLEDRIVKRFFDGKDPTKKGMTLRDWRRQGATTLDLETKEEQWKLYNKQVLTPSEEEISVNPRSRSAKFRGGIKL